MRELIEELGSINPLAVFAEAEEGFILVVCHCDCVAARERRKRRRGGEEERKEMHRSGV